MSWIAVSDRLPGVLDTVLVWVRYATGTGDVEIAKFRAWRIVHPEDPAAASHTVADPNFKWSGGDNDREWPQSTGWCGIGGYGYEASGDRVTHWMPLPEAP